MENKKGMITHYLNLDVEAKGIHKDMHFYIANIGKEDIFLGYPWLAVYEPCFKWRDATIEEEVLPVIIRSINPCIPQPRPVIAKTTLEDFKARIVQQLEEQSLTLYHCHQSRYTSRTAHQSSGTPITVSQICKGI